jgi:SAM-dependent methyltransferase
MIRSNRRVRLDALLVANHHVYKGNVLDVGGKVRGRFVKPAEGVRQWVVTDIVWDERPDVILDVAALPIASNSVDTIKATELFEHVWHPEVGLRECHRTLAPGGRMVLSVPFLHRLHADPSDFQRWTIFKWRKELEAVGFDIIVEEVTGTFFTVLGDMLKALLRSLPKVIRQPPLMLLSPLLEAMAKLDDRPRIRANRLLSSFHSGYFFVLQKPRVDTS